MPGALPKIRSAAARNLPTGLYLSFLFAGAFAFASLFAYLALIVAAIVAHPSAAHLAELAAQPEIGIASAFMLCFSAWLFTYWSALRRQVPWFREFAIVSCGAVYLAWGVAALVAGGSPAAVAFGGLFFVGLPWWYLYRRRSVVAYFEGLRRQAGRTPAA